MTVEIRAQIDTETVRALLSLNGGGAVAILTLLPSFLEIPRYEPLAIPLLIGVLILVLGLAFALIHNRLRRECSLVYQGHKMAPPPGRLLGFTLKEPTVCFVSIRFMWASAAAFVIAGLYVAASGVCILSRLGPT